MFSEKRMGFVQFIGLNPSTADEKQDDPTIRRCIGFVQDWGYSEFCMTNIFAYRATDPLEMLSQPDPVGVENDDALLRVAQRADLIIAAWGVHGEYRGRGLQVLKHLRGYGCKLHHLGLTNDGHPKHPLYLKRTTKPQLW